MDDTSLLKTAYDKFNNLKNLFISIALPSGIAILVCYWLKIGYFPRGISLGDAIYFFVIALTFSFLYGIFLLSLFSVSCLLVKLVFIKFPIKKIRRFYEKEYKEFFDIFGWIPTILFSMIGVALIFSRWNSQSIQLAVCSLVITLICADFYRLTTNARKLKYEINSHLNHDGFDKSKSREELTSTVFSRLAYMIVLFFLPLMLGLFGDTLTGAVSLAHLRENNVTVLVSKPFCPIATHFFPNNVEKIMYGDYCKLTRMVVVFQGMGENTLLARVIVEGEPQPWIPIPTSDVIVLTYDDVKD